MIIAHRGCSGYKTENSKNAFKHAIDINVEAVEFDIHKCKSGNLIVMHDADVSRTTNGTGKIQDKTLEELKNIKLKDDSDILTLEDVLDILDAKTKIIIDIKEEGVAQDIANIINFYVKNKNWNTEQFYATGFLHYELKHLKELCNFIKLIPSAIYTPYKCVESLKAMGAYGICLINIENCFSYSLAKEIKENGLQLWVWSPDESELAIKKLIDANVDAIMVDYPDEIKKIYTTVAIQDKIKKETYAKSLNLDPNKCYKILEYKYYNPDNKQNPVTILPIDIESGFIHMSFGSQVENTLNKFFKEIDKVIILEIDPNLLKQNGSQVIVEQNNNIGNYYPHIYGKQEILSNAITNIIYAIKDINGTWVHKIFVSKTN